MFLQSSFHDTLFKEPETSDEYSRDMELSDCEFPTQIFTREDTVFSASFSKSPNDRTTPDFSSSKTDEGNFCSIVIVFLLFMKIVTFYGSNIFWVNYFQPEKRAGKLVVFLMKSTSFFSVGFLDEI